MLNQPVTVHGQPPRRSAPLDEDPAASDAQLVAEHRMEEWEAAELAVDLSYNLAKAAYKL